MTNCGKYNNSPLVSVIMPVYNAAPFLEESVQSILNQTYKNFRLIIINDSSTDSSLEIATKLQKKYPNQIRLISLKKRLNRGGDSCANIGIRIATGTYIARMDADDISHPTRLEKQVKFLENNRDIFMVGASAYVINKNGYKIGEKNMLTSNDEIYKQYMTFHPMVHSTVMFRNKINKGNFYLQRFSRNNDYYTFFDLIARGYKFANLPEKLLKYRIYGNNDSLKNIKKSFFNTLRARLLILKKYSYSLNFSIVVKNVLQIIIVSLLPERFTYVIYLISRGIINENNIKKKIKNLFKISLISHRYRTFTSLVKN